MILSIAYLSTTAYAPHLSTLFKEGRGAEAIAVWRGTVRKIALLVVPIAMVFVIGAEEVIGLLFTADYLRGATVFRFYALITLGRVSGFGMTIVAAGKPEYLPRAAVLALLSNVVISVPLVMTLGFIGPAVGTAVAFVPTLVAYCYYISKASGVPLRGIFPFVDYLKVLGLALIAGAGALAFKLGSPLGAAATLGIEAVIVLGGFALLGSAAGLIERSDWVFLRDWFLLRGLRSR